DAALKKRCEDKPWDYELLWDLAQFRLERPETKRLAVEPLRQYVERHPRAEYMRDALARIGVPDEAEEFFEAFRADRDAALARRDEAPQDASTALLLDAGLVYFHPDGGTHSRFHQLEIALDRTGTEQLHEHDKAGYTRVAQVINSEGQIFEPIEVDGTWVMPSLDGGDVVEFEWDTYAQGEEGDAPELGFFFAGFDKPYMHSSLAVYVPDGTPGEFKAFQLAQNDVSWERQPWKNGTVHLFKAKHQERREPERGMPTPQETLPWVQYGSHETDANAIALWREQFAQNSTVAADLEAELRSTLIERGILDLPGSVAKAEGIWKLVYERILDWSSDGDTTDVWTLRRGDPLGLIGALLRIAEIPFDWGILYPATRPELNTSPVDDFMTLGDWEMPMIRLAPETEGAAPTYVSTLVRGMKFGELQEPVEGAKMWILSDSNEGEARTEEISFDMSSRFGTLLEVELVV
ncbi:MAG: hypothetical protein AAF368_12955, partial [Planctomycetota bacterium]